MKFEIKIDLKEEIDKTWDVIIIGGGPSGYSAAIYCGRYKLKTLVITKEVGGLLNEAHVIEDYPGFKSIKGSELGRLFKEHAEAYNVKTYIDEVINVEKKDKLFFVYTKSGKIFESKVLIVATGSNRRKLGVPGENLKGISYCAECDAPLYKNKIVAVIGGGNSAFHDVLVLSEYASKIYLIHRRDEFKADPIIIEKVKNLKNVEFLLNKVVFEIRGKDKVEEIILMDTKTNEYLSLKVDGVFVAIGLSPASEFLRNLGVEIDENGFIIVDNCCRTNVEGLLAAGDVTRQLCNFRQVITSAAMGAVAAMTAYNYLKTGKWK
ncbi:MAG: thioredoxin-disulfide reductase [Nanopusillaceae archaeon]